MLYLKEYEGVYIISMWELVCTWYCEHNKEWWWWSLRLRVLGKGGVLLDKEL